MLIKFVNKKVEGILNLIDLIKVITSILLIPYTRIKSGITNKC